jgi:hypothetical protein
MWYLGCVKHGVDIHGFIQEQVGMHEISTEYTPVRHASSYGLLTTKVVIHCTFPGKGSSKNNRQQVDRWSWRSLPWKGSITVTLIRKNWWSMVQYGTVTFLVIFKFPFFFFWWLNYIIKQKITRHVSIRWDFSCYFPRCWIFVHLQLRCSLPPITILSPRRP